MTDQELVDRAIKMQEFSYVPYSRFPVGAALLFDDGTVFTGCNVENAAFGSDRRRTGWMTLAIAGLGSDFCWPCGACRQMLYEFAPGLRVLAARGDGAFETATLDQLMPHGFGPLSLK